MRFGYIGLLFIIFVFFWLKHSSIVFLPQHLISRGNKMKQIKHHIHKQKANKVIMRTIFP